MVPPPPRSERLQAAKQAKVIGVEAAAGSYRETKRRAIVAGLRALKAPNAAWLSQNYE